MKAIRFFIVLSFIISCNNDKEEIIPISFSEKKYDEAFQLIEYWLNAQKDYENIQGLTAMVGDEKGVVW